jgi:hypothetical protein
MVRLAVVGLAVLLQVAPPALAQADERRGACPRQRAARGSSTKLLSLAE